VKKFVFDHIEYILFWILSGKR